MKRPPHRPTKPDDEKVTRFSFCLPPGEACERAKILAEDRQLSDTIGRALKCGECAIWTGYRFCHGPHQPVPGKDDPACPGFMPKSDKDVQA